MLFTDDRWANALKLPLTELHVSGKSEILRVSMSQSFIECWHYFRVFTTKSLQVWEFYRHIKNFQVRAFIYINSSIPKVWIEIFSCCSDGTDHYPWLSPKCTFKYKTVRCGSTSHFSSAYEHFLVEFTYLLFQKFSLTTLSTRLAVKWVDLRGSSQSLHIYSS